MALEAQNNPFTSVLMVEAADPEALPDADPSAGSQRLAVGTDHLLYLVNSSGTKTQVGGGGGIANPLATDSLWDAAGDLAQGTGANTGAKLTLGATGTAPVSNGTNLAYGYPNPSFRGWHLLATGVTMTSGGAWTVPFASESGGRDTNTYHDNSTNNSRCTVVTAVAGLYRCTVNVRFPTAFTGGVYVGILKNGTTWLPGGEYLANDAGAATDRQKSCSMLVEMANTDYVECGGLFTSGTRTDLTVHFAGEWLGA
jgi:hypothetical protein